jgi:hypothetical protein
VEEEVQNEENGKEVEVVPSPSSFASTEPIALKAADLDTVVVVGGVLVFS